MESKVNSPEEAAEKRASDLGDDREQAGTAGIVGIDVLASEKILDVLTSEEFLDLTPVVVVATKETTENGANDLRDEREETGTASVVEVNVLAGEEILNIFTSEELLDFTPVVVVTAEETTEKRADKLRDEGEQAGTAGVIEIDALACEEILNILASEEFLNLTPVVVVATKETTENGANDLRDEREETGAAGIVDIDALASKKILDVLASKELLDLASVVVVATEEAAKDGADDLGDEGEETGTASVVEVDVLAGEEILDIFTSEEFFNLTFVVAATNVNKALETCLIDNTQGYLPKDTTEKRTSDLGDDREQTGTASVIGIDVLTSKEVLEILTCHEFVKLTLLGEDVGDFALRELAPEEQLEGSLESVKEVEGTGCIGTRDVLTSEDLDHFAFRKLTLQEEAESPLEGVEKVESTGSVGVRDVLASKVVYGFATSDMVALASKEELSGVAPGIVGSSEGGGGGSGSNKDSSDGGGTHD